MKWSTKEYFGLGKVPVGIGAVLKGWDLTEKEFRDPKTLPIVDLRVMTEACLHDCRHCFTDKRKRTLKLPEIKSIIDQLAEMGCHSVDYLGEGEPTLDPWFFEIIEYTAAKGIQPVIFTDAATKMRDRDFVRKVYKTGASVSPKCDSIFNRDYQNWVVGDETNTYFDQRNEALNLLIEEGFSAVQPDGTTRLGLDMVLSRENIGEVEDTLRFCREKNLWIVFSFPLPVGRSGSPDFDISKLPTQKQLDEARDIIKRVDKEYGFEHESYRNFATNPCTEFLCVYGNGNVSACVGREEVVGNVTREPLKKLVAKAYNQYPCHDPTKFDGHCLCRKIK